MRDRAKVAIGLGAFLVILAYPVWSAIGADADERARPTLARAVDGPCIEDTTYMAAHHQDLLNDWRHAVVRQGERWYEMSSGAQVEMSLTKTCMRCHTNSQEFCERCHEYADVTPKCWSCHVAPEGT
jgi:hypothetical protein